MKKLTAVLLICVLFLSSCAAGVTETEIPAENPDLILQAVLDSLLRLTDSAEAESILNLTSAEARESLVNLANEYYLSLDMFSEDQCAALAAKLIGNTAQITEYRLEIAELNESTAKIKVFVNGIDKAGFSVLCDKLFLQHAGTGELTDMERATYSYKAYMEALDSLTLSGEETEITVEMTKKNDTWRILTPTKLIQKLFRVMIGA